MKDVAYFAQRCIALAFYIHNTSLVFDPSYCLTIAGVLRRCRPGEDTYKLTEIKQSENARQGVTLLPRKEYSDQNGLSQCQFRARLSGCLL